MKNNYKYTVFPLNKPIKYKKSSNSKENYLGEEYIILLGLIFEESHKASVGVIVQTEWGVEEYYDKDSTCFYTHYIPAKKL